MYAITYKTQSGGSRGLHETPHVPCVCSQVCVYSMSYMILGFTQRVWSIHSPATLIKTQPKEEHYSAVGLQTYNLLSVNRVLRFWFEIVDREQSTGL